MSFQNSYAEVITLNMAAFEDRVFTEDVQLNEVKGEPPDPVKFMSLLEVMPESSSLVHYVDMAIKQDGTSPHCTKPSSTESSEL